MKKTSNKKTSAKDSAWFSPKKIGATITGKFVKFFSFTDSNGHDALGMELSSGSVGLNNASLKNVFSVHHSKIKKGDKIQITFIKTIASKKKGHNDAKIMEVKLNNKLIEGTRKENTASKKDVQKFFKS